MRLIVASFLFMGLGYYELSGGADFVPESRAERVAVVQEIAPDAEVTRSLPDAGDLDLASLSTSSLNMPAIAPSAAVAQTASFETEAGFRPAPFTAEAPAPAAQDVVEVAAEVPSAEVVAEPAPDLRAVAGDRVNMRSGPGTGFDVLATLDSGTSIEVISVDAEGWARVRVAESGVEGWMAERLLTPAG